MAKPERRDRVGEPRKKPSVAERFPLPDVDFRAIYHSTVATVLKNGLAANNKEEIPESVRPISTGMKGKKGRGRYRFKNTIEKQVAALQLRKEGYSYFDIARICDYADQSGAYTAVQGAIKLLKEEAAKEIKKMELERLDMVIAGLTPRVQLGDPKAAHSYLHAMERRAKMMGLDAPTKTALTDDEGNAVPMAGVVLLPQHMSAEEWQKQAKKQSSAEEKDKG